VVDFGGGCSSSSSSSCCCDRGKTKSTPSPFDLDWNGLGLEWTWTGMDLDWSLTKDEEEEAGCYVRGGDLARLGEWAAEGQMRAATGGMEYRSEESQKRGHPDKTQTIIVFLCEYQKSNLSFI